MCEPCMENGAVEYLKSQKYPSVDDRIHGIAQYCEEKGITIGTLLEILGRSTRRCCSNNFIDDDQYGYCSDVEGRNVAFDLNDIAAAYGYDADHIRCSQVNERGCCAKINQMLYALERGLYEYAEPGGTEERVPEGA